MEELVFLKITYKLKGWKKILKLFLENFEVTSIETPPTLLINVSIATK